MREGMERADVRFSNFQLLLSTGISLRVDYEYPWSTAPGGLTFTSSLVGGCKSIFEAPFDAGTSCHSASLFGEYESAVPGAGIHWGPWLGMGVSLDYVRMKFRGRECKTVNAASGLCDSCEGGFD